MDFIHGAMLHIMYILHTKLSGQHATYITKWIVYAGIPVIRVNINKKYEKSKKLYVFENNFFF